MSEYLTIAALLSGFGLVVLTLRIQGEFGARDAAKGASGLAWADYLVLAGVMLALWLVILPVLLFGPFAAKIAGAACAASVVLFGAYLPAILDHHRMIIGETRSGRRERGEPVERIIVFAASALAVIVFLSGVTRGTIW